MGMIKLFFGIVGIVGLVYVSRDSLKHPGSHGFYRFFAWVAIWLGATIDLDVWFSHPLAWYQIISWLLLLVAAGLVLHGLYLLKRAGRQDAARNDSVMLPFEKTTAIVMVGAYRFIRHPLYSSLLFLAWGVFFKAPGWLGLGLALLATGFLVATARAEEAEDLRFFGPAYADYMRKTRRFIPFIF